MLPLLYGNFEIGTHVRGQSMFFDLLKTIDHIKIFSIILRLNFHSSLVVMSIKFRNCNLAAEYHVELKSTLILYYCN